MKILLAFLLLSACAFAQDTITITVSGKAQTFTLKPSLIASVQTLVAAEAVQNGPLKYKDVADFIIGRLNSDAFAYAAANYPDPVVKAKQDAVAVAVADEKATTDSVIKVDVNVAAEAVKQ